jgi:hypothetical protein
MYWVSRNTWNTTPWRAKRHYAGVYGEGGVYSICGVGPLVSVRAKYTTGVVCKNCIQIATKRDLEQEAPIVKINEAIAYMNKKNTPNPVYNIPWTVTGSLLVMVLLIVAALLNKWYS